MSRSGTVPFEIANIAPGSDSTPGLFLLPLRQCANPTAAAGVRGRGPFSAVGDVVVRCQHFEKSDMTQWYETLFANFGKTYDKECFTQGTVGEVDFVERELAADRSKRILDIGCGTGRHAIELAKRGYRVTGFDLSEGQLRLAREKAAAADVTVDFQRRDATQPHFNQEFDAAIMFCEGAFPLMETDEKNYAILTHAAAALRPGGKLLLTTLNALFPLFHSVKDFLDAGESCTAAGSLTFDLMTFREHAELTFTDDAGQSQTIADQRALLHAGRNALAIADGRVRQGGHLRLPPGPIQPRARADARRFRDACRGREGQVARERPRLRQRAVVVEAERPALRVRARRTSRRPDRASRPGRPPGGRRDAVVRRMSRRSNGSTGRKTHKPAPGAGPAARRGGPRRPSHRRIGAGRTRVVSRAGRPKTTSEQGGAVGGDAPPFAGGRPRRRA